MPKTVITASGKTVAAKSMSFVLTDYKRFVNTTKRDMRRIMQGVAEIVHKHTIPWVPVEYGGLRESGRAFAGRTGQGWAAFVTFGGEEVEVTPTPNAPRGIVDYATYVHELQVPYLELGGMDSRQEVESYIINELKKIAPKGK